MLRLSREGKNSRFVWPVQSASGLEVVRNIFVLRGTFSSSMNDVSVVNDGRIAGNRRGLKYVPPNKLIAIYFNSSVDDRVEGVVAEVFSTRLKL